MPVIRSGTSGISAFRSKSIPNLWPEDLMDQAAMQSVEMVALPQTVDQMLGAPTQVQAPDPLQVVKDKLLSVMTEADVVIFKDMMRRIHSVMTADDMAVLGTMASTAIESQAEDLRGSDEDSMTAYGQSRGIAPMFVQPGAGMGGHTWRSVSTGRIQPIIQLLDENDEEEDEGIQPGYNAATHEDAIAIVARFLEEQERSGVKVLASLPGSAIHFDDAENVVDPDGSDGLLRSSLKNGGYTISAKSNGMDSLTAMLSGASTTHYEYSDGRVTYEVTAQDIAAWKLDQAARLPYAYKPAVMQQHAQGQYVTTGQYVQSSQSLYIGGQRFHDPFSDRSLPDRNVQVLHGPSYDQIQEELKERRAAQARADQLLNSPNIKIEARPKKARVDPLTGVPAMPPVTDIRHLLVEDSLMTEETLVALANEAKHEVVVALGNGLKMTAQPATLPAPPPKPTHTAVYTPPVPLDNTMPFADLLAEVRRTFDFIASNWHPFDSKMSSLCLGVLDVFENYSPRTMEEVKEAYDLCISTLKPIHEILAVPIPRNTSQAAQQYLGSTSLMNITPSNISSMITSNSTVSVTLSNFTGAFSDKPVDLCWKLLAGHTYHLEDGSKIEIDATGNYTIHDKDATITYRASRMRDFNRFINGSDLVADFLETLAKLGTTQEQAAKAPLEMFIRWLIFKAAEHDHEEVTGVAPITAEEVAQTIGAAS